MPAPSPLRGSAPAAPRCSRLSSAVIALSTMSRLRRPCISTTMLPHTNRVRMRDCIARRAWASYPPNPSADLTARPHQQPVGHLAPTLPALAPSVLSIGLPSCGMTQSGIRPCSAERCPCNRSRQVVKRYDKARLTCQLTNGNPPSGDAVRSAQPMIEGRLHVPFSGELSACQPPPPTPRRATVTA